MRQAVFYLAISGFLMVFYQNCSGYFSGGGSVASSDCAASPSQMAPTFSTTFQPFFATHTCNTCHVAGGVQAGSPFGGPDPIAASAAFESVGGPSAIDSKLRAGHQGRNYDNLKPELDAASAVWNSQGFGICDNGAFTTSESRVNFFEAQIDEASGKYRVLADMEDVPQTIRLPLDDGIFDPSIEGAYITLEIVVQIDEDRFPNRYIVSNPIVSSPNQSISVEGVVVRLNGKPVGGDSWAGASRVINGLEVPLEGASTPIQILKAPTEPYARTDAWSVSFGALDVL